MNLEKTIISYLTYCQYQKRLDGKTIKAYRTDLNQFALAIQEHDDPFHKTIVSQYVQQMHNNFKPKTVKRKIASIRAFLNYLEFEDMIESNPVHKLRLEFREPLILPKSVPLQIVQQLLKTASQLKVESDTDYQQCIKSRNMAVLELLFATGLRVSELCSLRITDVNMQSGSIKVWGKGARERMVFVGNSEVLAALKHYRKVQERHTCLNDWFFLNRFGNRLSEQSVRDMIDSYAKLARIKVHITPHMMRHTFATLLLEADVDIRYIQSILGHSSISTTQIYTHVSQSKQRSILKNKNPRNRITIS